MTEIPDGSPYGLFFMSVRDTAAALGYSVQHIYRIARGDEGYQKSLDYREVKKEDRTVGYLISRASVNELLAKREQEQKRVERAKWLEILEKSRDRKGSA